MTHDERGNMTEATTRIDLNDALADLLDKYAVEPPHPWQIVDGRKPSGDTGDVLALTPGWSLTDAELPELTVPLLSWRHERRFIELKRLVDEKTVDPLLMCRFACLTDGQRMPLSAILYREFDLIEWISGTSIVGIYASISERRAANVIVRLADDVISSVEVGTTLPAGAAMQDRHEMIARRGVASDRVVDTQVGQSSVYSWTAAGLQQHTDVDAELFGLDADQVALVRSAYAVLCQPDGILKLRERHQHLRQLVESAYESPTKQGSGLFVGRPGSDGGSATGYSQQRVLTPVSEPVKIAMMSLTHGHTRKYFQTLQESPKLDWVAACAEDEAVRQRFERAVDGVPCYDDEEQMFDRHPDIEAAVLASANSEHLRQVEACASRGIHILSMKIPTFDLTEYDRMIEVAEEAGVVCQIELELHYNPVVQRIKKLVADGAVGRILSMQATNITLSPVWAFPWQGSPEQSYGSRTPLSDGDARFRGGALCDHPHVFDLIRWLTGSDFESIYADVAPNMRTDLEVEDILLAGGKMADGCSFLLDPSWSRLEERLAEPGPGWEVFPKRMEVNLTIGGERGTLMADCFGPNVYHNGAPNDRYTVQYTYFDEWIGMVDEFVDCVRNGRTPQINLRWHRRTIEAMNACYESIAAGQPIAF